MSGFLTEEAIQFLVQYYPIIPQKKPALFHSVRVASYMYINGYSEDLCVAGLLHDAIEDTPITKEMIAEKYSYYIADIVEANSKNLLLPKEEILEDIVQRCSQYGQDAMIIKIIEVYDNYLFYTRQIQEWKGLQSEIDRCKYIAGLVQKYKKDEWNDASFDLIDIILNS